MRQFRAEMPNLGLKFCTVIREALNDPSGLQKVVVQLIDFLVYGEVLPSLGHANSAWQIGCDNSRTAARFATPLRSAPLPIQQPEEPCVFVVPCSPSPPPPRPALTAHAPLPLGAFSELRPSCVSTALALLPGSEQTRPLALASSL